MRLVAESASIIPMDRGLGRGNPMKIKTTKPRKKSQCITSAKQNSNALNALEAYRKRKLPTFPPAPNDPHAALAAIHMIAVHRIKVALENNEDPDELWLKVLLCVEVIRPDWKGMAV